MNTWLEPEEDEVEEMSAADHFVRGLLFLVSLIIVVAVLWGMLS